MNRPMRSVALVPVLLLLWVSGCSAPPAAETVLEPLHELAEELSVFPAAAGPFRRIEWSFGPRSITAHYVRETVASDAGGAGSEGVDETSDEPRTAWVSRFVCQPEEQDPFAYASPARLIAGLKASHPTVETLDISEETLGDRVFNVVYFAIPGEVGSEIGVIAATVLDPEDDKCHVLLARASRTEVIGLITFPGLSWLTELLTPILEE